jgi:hypothetical protein
LNCIGHIINDAPYRAEERDGAWQCWLENKKQLDAALSLLSVSVSASAAHPAIEEIASFVEHLRDGYASTTEPVSKVARLIRERFASVSVSPSAAGEEKP